VIASAQPFSQQLGSQSVIVKRKSGRVVRQSRGYSAATRLEFFRLEPAASLCQASDQKNSAIAANFEAIAQSGQIGPGGRMQ